MHRLFILLCLLLASCGTKPLPPLEQSLAERRAAPELADLQRTALDLQGVEADRERLALVEGLAGEPVALAGGWLIEQQLAGESLLAWLAPGGRAEEVARGRATQLVDLQGERALLLVEGEGSLSVLKAVSPRKGKAGLKEWILAEGADGCLRLDESRRLLLRLVEDPSGNFSYASGSWRLENEAEIRRDGKGWSLAAEQPHESAFRALHRFLDNARRGKWSKARKDARLERLLALPGGGHSTKLGPSLRLSVPRLLQRELRLTAPPLGEIRRLESVDGSGAWRVEVQQSPGEGWKVCRLERVL